MCLPEDSKSGKYRPRRSRLMNCRASHGNPYNPTDVEHVANIMTHGLLIAPSLTAVIWMLHLAAGPLQFLVAFVYGLALIVLFTVSTLFHTCCYVKISSNIRYAFHFGDRATIYLFIAASYTPWLALNDINGWDKLSMVTVWSAAVLGICYQYIFYERYKWLEIVFYLAIGVCPSVTVLAMRNPTGIPELAFGGLIYILGVVFFKCDGLIPFAHAIWHCFVATAAAIHYFAVCRHLLTTPSQTNQQTFLLH